MTDKFRAFGLNIFSKIPQDFFSYRDILPEVIFKVGDIPDKIISDVNFDKNGVQCIPGKILQKTEKYSYLISDGKEVVLSKEFIKLDKEIQLIFYEIFAMYLWMQRGAAVFHASAVNVSGEAVVFMGDGGAGKSTTSFYFNQKGHEKLSDDTCLIIPDKNGTLTVVPSCIKQKLTLETLNMLDIPTENLKKIKNEDKYRTKVENNLTLPIPLAVIFCISISSTIEKLEIESVKGIEKLAILNKNLLKQQESMDIEMNKGAYAKFISEIAKRVKIYSIKRVPGKNSLEEIYEEVRKILNKSN